MGFSSVVRNSCLQKFAAAVCLLVVSLPAWTHETEVKSPDFGFRPDTEYAQAFLEALDSATVQVYPTLIRRSKRTAVSFTSQEKIVELLKNSQTIEPSTAYYRIDLGELTGASQWSVFEEDMKRIAKEFESETSDADYRMVFAFLMPVSDQSIFGVHCYVFDREGNNVFSFLLNSHHQPFLDANLDTDDASEEAREKLIERATTLGVQALQAQIERAGICGTHTETSPLVSRNGLVDDFETGLPEGSDQFGVPIGFVPFTDETSTVEIVATDVYPELPAKPEKNSVLRIDMNVTEWAAVAHIFQDQTANRWVAHDWSPFDEMSFWFYGNNSGTKLFVDVLDNRNTCSTVDDAERYVYEFTDDFSGWERVFVPFRDMRRKEVGNGAPNDGLGLSAVHGWAIGALNTGGPITFYIDDVDVLRTPAANVDYPINELPMYGGRKKTTGQKRADKIYIEMATEGGRSREEAAELAAGAGWHLFYKGDESTAIKRFNQAWLLDPDNQLALWGFGVVSSTRRQYEDGIRYFEMAMDRGPENPNLVRDYEYARKQLEKSKLKMKTTDIQ